MFRKFVAKYSSEDPARCLSVLVAAENARIVSKRFGYVLFLLGLVPEYSKVDSQNDEGCCVEVKSDRHVIEFGLYFEKQSVDQEDFEDCNILSFPVYVKNISSVSCENTRVMIDSEVSVADSAEREESSGDLLLDTLKNLFRSPSFRPSQREIIETINNGKDALVVLSTGGGKTLCFALPAILFDGLTVVIVPLISLMYNLHYRISHSGISCKAINENTTLTEFSDLYHDLCSQNPSTKVVVVTPEGLKRS